MKNKKLIPIAAILLAALTALASCSAADKAYGNSAPEYDYAAGEKVEAGGMDGDKTITDTVGSLNGNYERKVIRTVKMSCETKAYAPP